MERHLGLQRGIVEIRAYDPGWVAAYKAERVHLLSLLSGLVMEIEHVGSTAVPGLSAKPAIDMLIGLPSFDLVDEAVAILVSESYVDRGRDVAGRHLVVKETEECRTHYLHLVAHGSVVWRELLLFRDHLRDDGNRAHAYEDLKWELVEKFPADRDAYAAGKKPFILETLALARRASEEQGDR
jgi:GrpB-like predicted nucleotidyltransferase (UPF0157 family)